MFKVSICSEHYLPIFRRHYTNTGLVITVCGCADVGRCVQSSHIPRPTHIYNCTQQPPNLRSCSVSWRWARNARNISRLWTLIKCKWKWKWSVYQVGCAYYVITSLWGTVNKTLNKVGRTNLISCCSGSWLWLISNIQIPFCHFKRLNFIPVSHWT
jgi:hypothetical protein